MRSVLRSSNVLTIAGHLLIPIAIQKYFQHQGENRNYLKGSLFRNSIAGLENPWLYQPGSHQ